MGLLEVLPHLWRLGVCYCVDNVDLLDYMDLILVLFLYAD